MAPEGSSAWHSVLVKPGKALKKAQLRIESLASRKLTKISSVSESSQTLGAFVIMEGMDEGVLEGMDEGVLLGNDDPDGTKVGGETGALV